MALSIGTTSFGLVAFAAMTLFIIGPPGSGHEAAPRAGLAVAGSSTTAAVSAAVAKEPTQVAVAGITLRSVTVTLPTSDRTFPGGAAADAVNNNCVACHSPGMVLNQPALSRAEWQAEVTKMRSVYKAPIDDGDVAGIVDYLAKTKGL